MHYIFTLYSIFFNPYTCFGLYKAILNVDYEPPEDGLVRAETYVGVKE
jgi:hypothetical protein